MKELKRPKDIRCFMNEGEDEIIYLIPSAINGKEAYIVVYDDAYEIRRGTSEMLYLEEVEKKFNLKL